MSDLHTRHCKTEAGRLPDDTAQQLLGDLTDWRIDAGQLQKTYTFKNYYATMAFVNLVAWISHHENHHPDLHVSFNRCRVAYSTHSAGGLSENDFICAARIDAALSA